MAEFEERADFAVRGDGGARGGVVYGTVLCAVLYADDLEGEREDRQYRGGDRAAARDAVLHRGGRTLGPHRAEEADDGRMPAGSADVYPDLQGDGARCRK